MTLEAGKFAGLANGAVTVRYGDTVILVAAVMSAEPRAGIDFFPLTIDYEERLYAAGKIPGSFFRREGRPSTAGILTARLTDRPLRPLFPKGMRNDVQITVTTLSADQENDPDILSIIGASAALTISDIPFGGPVSGTRIAYIDGEFVVNPTFAQLKDSSLEIVVAGTKDAVVMVEAGANELSEALILEAIQKAQEVNAQVIELQEEMQRRMGKPKFEFEPTAPSDDVAAGRRRVRRLARLGPHRRRQGRARRADATGAGPPCSRRWAKSTRRRTSRQRSTSHLKSLVRNRIVNDGVRPDGRQPGRDPPDQRPRSACCRERTAPASSRAARRRSSRSRRSAPSATSRSWTGWSRKRRDATSTTTTSRRSRSARRGRCAAPAGATSATARWRSARSCPWSRTRRSSRTRSASSRRCSPATAAPRWPAPAAARWR